jgi:hypothetical protein
MMNEKDGEESLRQADDGYERRSKSHFIENCFSKS